MNQKFFSMIDRYKHQQLRIGLVSPQQISAWANKTLTTLQQVLPSTLISICRDSPPESSC